jgi:hypothetical protein
MANPLITIGNELHGNVITREMTDDERDAYRKSFADEDKAREAQTTTQAAKEIARKAVLAKLGLSDDEAIALFS